MRESTREQRKNLIKYIIPSMISFASFYILTIVDGMFVGNGVGIDALGAVNIALPFTMIVIAIATLLSIGGVAVASVRLGRADEKGANQVFMHSFTTILVLFAIFTLVGMTQSRNIAGLLGANDTYLDMVSDYLFWYSLFILPVGLYTLLSAFCRNDGNPKLVTIAAVVCVVTNIIGDWVMVFPLKKGIAGAAFATGFSNLVAVIILLAHFFFKKGKLRIARFKFKFNLLGKISLRGLPEMIAQFAAPITTMSMNTILLGNLGDAAVNAYSVISYVSSLFVSLINGVSSGLQPLFGHSYGAKDEKSLKYYLKSGILMSVVGGIFAFGLTFILGDPACSIFGADSASKAIVVSCLPKYCLNFVFATFSSVLASYLFSTKRTGYAIPLNISRSIVFNFACINFLPLIFGSDFVWYSLAVAEAICLFIGVVLWRVSERKGIAYK